MKISGGMGFTIFLIVNYTHVFGPYDVLAACVQIIANVFVFVIYRSAFLQCTRWGVGKLVGLGGMILPVWFGTQTFRHIVYPALVHLVHRLFT